MASVPPSRDCSVFEDSSDVAGLFWRRGAVLLELLCTGDGLLPFGMEIFSLSLGMSTAFLTAVAHPLLLLGDGVSCSSSLLSLTLKSNSQDLICCAVMWSPAL